MPSRRDYLATAGTLGLGALAGCSGLLPVDDRPPPPADDAATWVASLGSGGPIVAGPDAVFGFPDREAVAAHDPATGERLWRSSIPGPFAGATVADGTLYVVADRTRNQITSATRATVVAFDARDGSRRWRTEVDVFSKLGRAGLGAATADAVYVVQFDGDGGLAALAAADGSVRWETGRLVETVAGGDDEGVDRDAGGGVVAGGGDEIVSRDADGAVRWRRSLGDSLAGGPVVRGDRVYVHTSTTAQPAVHALDLASGAVRWERPNEPVPDTASTFESFTATPRGIVVDGPRTTAYAPDGGLRWESPTVARVPGMPYTDALLFGLGPEPLAFDRGTGEVVWRSDLTDVRGVHGVHAGLLVASTGSRVVGLGAGTGTHEWTRRPPEAVEAAVATGDRVLVATEAVPDGPAAGLYAYSLPG